MTPERSDAGSVLDEQLIWVRDGELVDAGSWIYVWARPGAPHDVIHVGATGLPPEARTWLHLHAADPKAGRVRTERPDALVGDVAVRAFRLDPALDRRDVTRDVEALLAGSAASQGAVGAAAAEIVARLGIRPAPDPTG